MPSSCPRLRPPGTPQLQDGAPRSRCFQMEKVSAQWTSVPSEPNLQCHRCCPTGTGAEMLVWGSGSPFAFPTSPSSSCVGCSDQPHSALFPEGSSLPQCQLNASPPPHNPHPQSPRTAPACKGSPPPHTNTSLPVDTEYIHLKQTLGWAVYLHSL